MPPADSASAPVNLPPFKPLPQKAPDIAIERRADGCILLRSRTPMGERPRSVPHLLDERAAQFPERAWIKQRLPGFGPWRAITYGEGARFSSAAAARLKALGLGPDAPLMILSGNSIEHAVMQIAAMKIRAPAAPISVPYSTMSSDFGKLKHCFSVIAPKAIFVQAHAPFAQALAALDLSGIAVISADDAAPEGVIRYADLIAAEGDVSADMAAIDDATVAKFLFTSGSTGMPKAAPQTHGMMMSLIAAVDGLRDEPRDLDANPQSLDWMPWNHISAGNIGFNGVMWSGATLHLDDGKPLPGQFEYTIKNLYEVSPLVFGSAPIAYAMLADAMDKDPKLRAAFFKNLRQMGYGGATLSDDLYDRMQAHAIAETGYRMAFTTMYGATETQGVTGVHWAADRVGLIGLPYPGITIKLVPAGAKYEVRVKGPTVTSGYHKDPERTAAAFDEEGFYKLGDAARFVDPDDPAQGLVFDGRVTEDFKLASGTWVSVGTLRPDLVAALTPLIFDAVIAGQDRPYAAALVWPAPAALQAFAADGAADPLGALRAAIAERLRAFNAGEQGSSRKIARVIVMTEPPSIDAGEITEKGYVNQRATLDRRKALVDALYANPTPPDVIVV
ncbi:MAG: AMP-binding protein [Hyphomonadaceae bacterium]|nr:AMP-binding protein [Hyphomonadaceae bacterium]